MLDKITNNPFRILGVYSNAKQADIVKNFNKIKAYLNVGKDVSFPLDLEFLLGTTNRSLAAAQKAQADINLPKDKIHAALFWFCKGSNLDEMALNYLSNQDIVKCLEILNKKTTYSSLVNLAVVALVQGRYQDAIGFYSQLIHDSSERNQFVTAICGDTFLIEEDTLMHFVIDDLLTEIKPLTLRNALTIDSDKSYVSEKALAEPIAKITSEIAKAKLVSGSDAAASLRAGRTLIQSTKTALALIKSLAGATSIQYQSAADNLAKQILQCGINYFNNTDDDNDVDTALELQQYALSIAVGKLARDRCQQNVDILLKKKENVGIEDDVKFIAEAIKGLKTKTPSIDNAKSFLTTCSTHLQVLKNALGADNDLYLTISTAVANNALGMIIDVVNNASTSNIFTYKALLDNAMGVVNYIDHHIDKTKQEEYRLLTNAQTLGKLQMNAILAEAAQKNRQTTTSSGGCYIATMVYGDYDHPQVLVLRDFRDTVLQRFSIGRAFIRFYYRYSPTWVEHLKEKKRINSAIRYLLDKFILIYKNEKD